MLLNEAEAGQYNHNRARGFVRSSFGHISPSIASSRPVSPPVNHRESRGNRRTRRRDRTVEARDHTAANRNFPAAFKSQYTLESAIQRIQHMTDHCRNCGAWHWERKLFRVTEDEIEYTNPVASEVVSCCHRFSLLLIIYGNC